MQPRMIESIRPIDGQGCNRVPSGKVEPSETILVADCKIATGLSIDTVCNPGFGFIARCPDKLGNWIRDDIICVNNDVGVMIDGCMSIGITWVGRVYSENTDEDAIVGISHHRFVP